MPTFRVKAISGTMYECLVEAKDKEDAEGLAQEILDDENSTGNMEEMGSVTQLEAVYEETSLRAKDASHLPRYRRTPDGFTDMKGGDEE
jgi:regulatory protein YycI of two-component signal transduction system YycFG